MPEQSNHVGGRETDLYDEMRAFDALPSDYRAVLRDAPWKVSAEDIADWVWVHSPENIRHNLQATVARQVLDAYGPAHPQART